MILESDEDIMDIIDELKIPKTFDHYDIYQAMVRIGLINECENLRGPYLELDESYYSDLLKNPADLMEELF